jgi:AAA15 family ATPase/GTPase
MIEFLKLKEEYKSIKNLPIKELPDFTVITGVNGSGKTQFLEAINNFNINTDQIDHNHDVEFLRLNFSSSNDRSEYFSNRIFDYYIKPAISTLTNQKLDIGHIEDKQITIEQALNLISQNEGYQGKSIFQISNEYLAQNPIFLSTFPVDDYHLERLRVKIKEWANLNSYNKAIYDISIKKNINRLDSNDFERIIRFDKKFHVENISSIYYEYWDRYIRNLTQKTYHEHINPSFEYLSEEEFKKKWGENPWEIFNEILSKTEYFNYITTTPEETLPSSFELKLIHKEKDIQIEPRDLSSGENVIWTMLMAMFKAKLDGSFPKLLLLDEVDAVLHPSATKTFLKFIQEDLVKKFGVKVIMATHSATTVALAPEGSVYVMEQVGKRKAIKKTSRDKALLQLTEGVHTLSINYENRKQVFVESPNDVKFYETVYTSIKNLLNLEISLNFIAYSNDKSEGGCTRVRQMVNRLREHGNQTVCGIIDRDEKNNESPHIKKTKERYALENFVYDPLAFGVFLLKEGMIEPEKMGLKKDFQYSAIIRKEATPEELQTISDFVISKLEIPDSPKTKIKYLGGFTLDIPYEFLNFNAHKLDEKFIDTFIQLNRYSKSADKDSKKINKTQLVNKVTEQLIEKIFKEYKELIPESLLQLFERVQSIN